MPKKDWCWHTARHNNIHLTTLPDIGTAATAARGVETGITH